MTQFEDTGNARADGTRAINPLQWLATKLVRFYQIAISPLFGPTCKYYPSCSAYAIEAVRVQGFFKGTGLAVWRVLRCNPWSHGGVDFPPGSDLEVPIPPDPVDDVVDEDVPGPTGAGDGHPHSHPHTPTRE
ncbi:MAG TPA: membrane protein insertion efficiency factor YidD [Actinomycetaceae bacterium]|nr:membrane protein insertion efficiency factor YidD [Actinomycetaceae bacterium]